MSKDPAFLINHELRKRGLASLGEGGALISQLAMFVRDDSHLRSLINACEPEERRHMYDALVPNLRFKARSLDAYVAELAIDAEIRQLPTVGADGQFKPFRVAELQSPKTLPATDAERDAEFCTAAIAQSNAKQHLHVVCVLCTAEEVLHGATKEDVVRDLRALGWRPALKRTSDDDDAPREEVEVCPKCVRARAPRFAPQRMRAA